MFEKYNFLLENILFLKEKTMSAGEILLGMGANEFLNEMADKGVQKAVKSYEDALNDPMWLGYMIKTDLAGYLRALSKAKTTFRGINPKDAYCGMKGEGNTINPAFVAVVEDFYLEIRAGLNKYDYQLAKYNFLRDHLIERFEGDENYQSDESVQEFFGISRKEMFEKLRNNEFVWIYSIGKKIWLTSTQDSYKQYVAEKRVLEHFPIAS